MLGPALRAATASNWTEVQLVRVNPQGTHIDGENESVWDNQPHQPAPVLAELKTMRAKGRGVIGMKIFGNGLITDPADQERAALEHTMELIDSLAAELDGIYLITPGSRWRCLLPLIGQVNRLRGNG